jgi:hypothetical protein
MLLPCVGAQKHTKENCDRWKKGEIGEMRAAQIYNNKKVFSKKIFKFFYC